ncbi:MAG: PqqD family protein [Acidobacteriota bacterium]
MKREHSAPEARKEGLIVHPISEEVLVYDLDRHKAHSLNKTAALVWNRCDGKTSVAELAQCLGDELKAPVDQDVVWLALDQLAKARLLHEHTPMSQKPGLSRRELIKRIGVGGAMALPLITSIIAPTAAQAATQCSSVVCSAGICPTGCICAANGSPCV